MTWARFDDGFYENRKVVPLSDAAFRLYVCMVTMSRQQDLDGRVDSRHVRQIQRLHRLGDPAALIGELIECDLVTSDLPSDTAWLIHDYHDYDPPKTNAERQRSWKARHRPSPPRDPSVTASLEVTTPVPGPVPVGTTSPPSTEVVNRSLERERVLDWLGELGRDPDYAYANKLCVSEGWTASEVIAASKIAIGKYGAKRPLSYIQREVDGHSSLLSRTKVRREEAAHAERKVTLGEALPGTLLGALIDKASEGMKA